MSCDVLLYSYKYYGVINGWDEHCCMPLEWINQMRVFQLSHGANQPFYSTLVGDGTTRYVAQGVCMYVCVRACARARVCVCVRAYMCMHACVCVHMQAPVEYSQF